MNGGSPGSAQPLAPARAPRRLPCRRRAPGSRRRSRRRGLAHGRTRSRDASGRTPSTTVVQPRAHGVDGRDAELRSAAASAAGSCPRRRRAMSDALGIQRCRRSAASGEVRAGEHRDPDHVDVFLDRRLHDLVDRPTKAEVDDLGARVAQRHRDHLDAPVVPVETGLREQRREAVSHELPRHHHGPPVELERGVTHHTVEMRDRVHGAAVRDRSSRARCAPCPAPTPSPSPHRIHGPTG